YVRHVPATHSSSIAQTTPQAPQCVGSVDTLKQETSPRSLGQGVVPLGHPYVFSTQKYPLSSWSTPRHVLLSTQLVVHAEQCCASPSRSKQPPLPHFVSRKPQSQVPPAQYSPASAHVVAQSPQWRGSS